jgi:hypothetical protein
MPGFLSSFYDAGEEFSVQYDTMKTGKINRKTEKKTKKGAVAKPDRQATAHFPLYARHAHWLVGARPIQTCQFFEESGILARL